MKINLDKKKLAVIISICVCVLVFIIAFFLTFTILNHKQKTNNQNNIESEENIEEEEKIIIKEDNEEEQDNQEELKNEEENSNVELEENNIKTEIEENENNNITGTTPYYIKVNYGANTVTIYKKDEEGNYTIPIKAMICSTGDYTPPCPKYPKNIYNTNGEKYKWATLEGKVYGQYATRITGGILFHSVPYTDGWKNSAKGTLEWWEYDKLGTKASLGCVRLTVADAKWIYDNIGKGTTVEFYSDSNPGPLGKPTAKKISDYPDIIKGWDPTDPDQKNPWKTYTEPVNTKPTTNEKNTNTVTSNKEETNVKTENKQETNTSTNTKADNKENTNISNESEKTKNKEEIKLNTETNKTEDKEEVKTNTETNKIEDKETAKSNKIENKETAKSNTETNKTEDKEEVKTNTETNI